MGNHWLYGIILSIILITGVTSTNLIFADDDKEKKFEEKIKKIKDEAKNASKDVKNNDREKYETDDPNSKKISKSLTKSIKNQKDRQEFGVLNLDDQGKTTVYLHLTDKESLNKIPSKYEIVDYYDDIAVAKLSLAEMNEISNMEFIKKIGPLQKAVPYTHQASEGVVSSAINNFHAAGFDGTGINVAIIDVSFVISDPEIASNCGDTSGDSHGNSSSRNSS